MTVADLLHEKGFKEGVQESRRGTAINALKKGLEISLIQEITGLSMETLTELKSELKL